MIVREVKTDEPATAIYVRKKARSEAKESQIWIKEEY
jgi:hypothetical protein